MTIRAGRYAKQRSSLPRPACGERSDGIEDDIRVRGTLRESSLWRVPLTRSLRGVYRRAALRADPLAPASTSPRKRGEVRRALRLKFEFQTAKPLHSRGAKRP